MSAKVLYLASDLFSKGGIMRYCRSQIQSLREAVGQDAVTVCSVHSPGLDSLEEDFPVDYCGQGVSLRSRLRYAERAVRYSITSKPDLIWTNHISLLPLANYSARLSGVKATVTNVYGLEVWSGMRNREKRAVSVASQIVSDCHFTANFMHEEFRIPNERIATIWDPVDVERFVPKQTASKILPKYEVPYSSDVTYLMTLGRVSKRSRHKGYDRMLDIMGQLEREDIVYLIVGDGDDRERLESRVRDEGLQGKVFFFGSVPEEDLVDVYNAADIFVLVSDRGPGRGEGVPLTPLEAASCGKPIIVGDEDGSPEAVEEGKTGFIVSPRDLASIQSAILRLVDDGELRKEIGHKAREKIVRDFSYQVFKHRTESLLYNILKQT